MSRIRKRGRINLGTNSLNGFLDVDLFEFAQLCGLLVSAAFVYEAGLATEEERVALTSRNLRHLII